MAEIYTVTATVISIGTLNPFTSKAGKQLTSFEFEIQVGDEIRTATSLGYHWESLKVGNDYELQLMPADNSDYPPSLRAAKLVKQGSGVQDSGSSNEDSKPAPKPAPTPAAQPALKPDFAARFREWNMHSRNAKIQARERTADYIKLAMDGKLLNDNGEAVTGLRLSTIRAWHKEEYALYFEELDEHIPQDTYGAFKESDDANS